MMGGNAQPPSEARLHPLRAAFRDVSDVAQLVPAAAGIALVRDSSLCEDIALRRGCSGCSRASRGGPEGGEADCWRSIAPKGKQ